MERCYCGAELGFFYRLNHAHKPTVMSSIKTFFTSMSSLRGLVIVAVYLAVLPGLTLAEDPQNASADWSFSQIQRAAASSKPGRDISVLHFKENGHLELGFCNPERDTLELAREGKAGWKVVPGLDWKLSEIVQAIASVVDMKVQHVESIEIRLRGWLVVTTGDSWKALAGGGHQIELRHDGTKGWVVLRNAVFDR